MFSVMKIKTLAVVVISGMMLHAHANKGDRVYVKGGILIYKGAKGTFESFEISKYEITN